MKELCLVVLGQFIAICDQDLWVTGLRLSGLTGLWASKFNVDKNTMYATLYMFENHAEIRFKLIKHKEEVHFIIYFL